MLYSDGAVDDVEAPGRAGAGRELRARRRGRPSSSRSSQYTRAVLPPTPALEPAHHGRPARSWPTPSPRSSRPSACPAYVAAVLEVAGARSRCSSCSSPRSARTSSARALGMRFGGALLAGVVFAFGTFFVVWLAWPLTNIFPLMPWLLLLTELVVRRPGAAPGGGPGGARGARTFLGGHPETSFHVMFATVVFFAFRAAAGLVRAEGASGARSCARRSPSGPRWCVGTAMAAVMLAAALRAALALGRLRAPAQDAPLATRAEVPGRAVPARLLGPRRRRPRSPRSCSNRGYYAGGHHAHAGRRRRSSCARTRTRIAFAAFGVLVARRRPRASTPSSPSVHELPGFRTAHNGRMVIFLLFALAMLAGWGLDELCRREPAAAAPRASRSAPRRRSSACRSSGCSSPGRIDLAPAQPALKVAWGVRRPARGHRRDLLVADTSARDGDRPPERAAAVAARSPARACALIALRLRRACRGCAAASRWPRSSRWPWRSWWSTCSGPTWASTRRSRSTTPPSPRTGAIRYLQSRRPNRFAGLEPPGLDPAAQPDLAMRYGLYDARGYDYPVERRYDRFWRATAAPATDFIPPTDRGAADRAVAARAEPAERHRRAPGPGGRPAAPARPAGRLLGAATRACTATPTRCPARSSSTASGRSRGADAALAAVDPALRRPPRGRHREAAAGAAAGPRPAGRVRAAAAPRAWSRYGDERRGRREATTPRSSLLVLTDVHYPGWKATRRRPRRPPIERVDYLLRGVTAPGRDPHGRVPLRAGELARRLDRQRARLGRWPA